MPLRASSQILPKAGWTCPQCTVRSFMASARQLQYGPEHPRYIEIPEPPQQSTPHRPHVKGVLPVPRNVLSGASKDRANDETIDLSTRLPSKTKVHTKGSREEWKAKMSDLRRQNLREGLKILKARQVTQNARSQAKAIASQKAREQALHTPEREDERLTAPSVTMDVESLLKGPVPDPTREERFLVKRANYERHANVKRDKRMSDLHTLYMTARKFIVTLEDFDNHVEEVFGTDEKPVLLSNNYDTSHSIWVHGKPVTVQDILGIGDGSQVTGRAVEGGTRNSDLQRVTRIAETLTGGKMQDVQ